MSRAPDLRVAIDRVSVRAGAIADRRPAPVFVVGYGSGRSARPHDHRIVVRELQIEVEAELDASAARRLGKQVASDLAGRLAELQERRRPRGTGEPAVGPIHVETVRVRLWGEPARHPPIQQIAAAVMTALEDKVSNAA